MLLREILVLALESLRMNKLRSGLTMLGMMIGVGAVVLLVSVGNGAKNYIIREFESMGTNLVMILPGKAGKRGMRNPHHGVSKEKLGEDDVEALARQSLSLKAATGILFGSVKAKVGDAVSDTQVLGSNEKLLEIFNWRIGSGSYFSEEDARTGRRVVVLGHQVSRDLFGESDPLGRKLKINDSEHRVVGVMRKSGQSLGVNTDEILFIPNKSVMRLLNTDRLVEIAFRAKSRVSVGDATEEIRAILKARHNNEEDFTLMTQASMLETMNTILGMLTLVLGGIAMISMAVGGIGIMNIMLVSVTERTREIGIRRAVGARRRDILTQFLAEAVSLSLIGGLAGLTGSVGISWGVTTLVKGFDMRPPAWILGPAFGLSCLVGIGFGVWPARKASRIPIIEALRFE